MSSLICKLCESGMLDKIGHELKICSSCRSRLGIVPMPVARRTTPCARCNGMKFIRSIPRELSASGGDYVTAEAAPMSVTLKPNVQPRMVFSGKTVGEPYVNHGLGQFELYICAACGFCDWYVTNPAAIPIGPEYMTDLVDLDPSTPYR